MSTNPGDNTENPRQVPTFGRGTRVYQGVLAGDPVSGEDHSLSVYAYYRKEDGFELTIHDGGHWPVDELHTAVWVDPEHVPDLLQALGEVVIMTRSNFLRSRSTMEASR